MSLTSIDPNNIVSAEARVPPNTPIVMVNLLRFRDIAEYAGEPADPSISGREVYLTRYVPNFNKAATKVAGIEPLYLGEHLTGIVSSQDEAWDVIALIKYPSLAAFREVTESATYKESAQLHRLAALQDWRLYCSVEMRLG